MPDEATLEEKFKTAVEIVQNLPKDGPITTSNDEKLMFYGLYKQATTGTCTTPRPSMFNIVERYKWDAWKKNAGMTSTEAMEKYLEGLLFKINEVEKTHDVEQWLTGDLFDFMMPKFAVIGKHYGAKEENIEKDEEMRPISPLSDTEYCDAVEDDDRGSGSSYELQDSPSSGSNNAAHVQCHRVEEQLKRISEQIEQLRLLVEQRHSALLHSINEKKRRFSSFVGGKGWTILFFLFVWPFVARVLFSYLRRTLSIIFR